MTEVHQTNNLRINFEQEAIPHLEILYNFALRLTGRRRTAYKLLQETYVRAIRFYDMLDKSIDFKSWMFRIMRNAYFDKFSKKIKTDSTDYAEVENSLEKLNTAIDFVQLKNLIFKKLNEDEISILIASLPDDFKMVIVLCDIIKFNYDEIADFVDVPEGTVRSRIHRGRKMLFVKLYKYIIDEGYLKNDSHITE